MGVLSLASVGLSGLRGFLNLLIVSAGGEWYGMKEPLMINLVGLLWRVIGGLGANVIHIIGWVVYGITIIGLCVLWSRSKDIGEKEIGIAVVLAVFAVPHLHYHDLTLLLVALVAALVIMVRGGFLSAQKAALLPLALSLVLLLSNSVLIVKLNFPYLVMLGLVLALYFPSYIFRGKARIKEQQPDGIG
jgi:hypothetical protein